MSIYSTDPVHDERHDALLDELLIEYLTDLDLYQAAQARLQASLKQAYFDLARSKLAVGAAKMSQDGYDLSQTCANVAIAITTENELGRTSTSSRMGSKSLAGHDTDRPSFSWGLGPHPGPADRSSPSNSAEPSHSTSLRSRSNTSTSKPTSTHDSSSKKSEPGKTTQPPRPLQRSPLLQFSAFPPTALRSAEQSWQKVLRSTVELTETKYKLEASEERVRQHKAAKIQAGSEITKSH